jgi:hypothetical protein
MLKYSDQTFEQRLERMGDEAESAFEEYMMERAIPFARIGLNRPPFLGFFRLPSLIQTTPDYLIELSRTKHYAVECKGCSKGKLKIKESVILSSKAWEDTMGMDMLFFVHDSSAPGLPHAMILGDDLRRLALEQEKKAFENDGKVYYEFKNIHEFLRRVEDF